MKKRLLALLALPLLTACSGETYNPRFPYPGPDPEVKDRIPVKVLFYLDNTHSEEPIATLDWYTLEPIGECPALAVLTDKDAPDPLYPTFLGYSEYSSSIDEDHIWDFEKDYIQQGPEFKLYGIWACK